MGILYLAYCHVDTGLKHFRESQKKKKKNNSYNVFEDVLVGCKF